MEKSLVFASDYQRKARYEFNIFTADWKPLIGGCAARAAFGGADLFLTPSSFEVSPGERITVTMYGGPLTPADQRPGADRVGRRL